jgi:hypothetical protein
LKIFTEGRSKPSPQQIPWSRTISSGPSSG